MTTPGGRAMLVLLAVLMAGCEKPEAAKRRHAAMGDQYATARDDAAAIIEYRNALQIDPRLGEVRLKLAEAYARERTPGLAAAEYLAAADLLPHNLQAQLRAATIHLAAGNFERAHVLARAALKIDPSSLIGQLILAHSLAELKDVEGALQEIQEAIRSSPDDPRAYTSLAILRARQGNRSEAEAAFKQAVATAPRSVEARLALAYFHWASGRLEETERGLREAGELDPANTLTERMLALLYVTTARSAQAEASLLKLAGLGDSGATLMLADIYMTSGRQANARPLYERLKADESARTTAIARLATLDYAAGKQKEAHQAVDEGLSKHPEDLELLGVKAGWYVGEKRLDAALEVADKAVAAKPSSAAAHHRSGLVRMARGEYDEAARSFEQAVQRNPRLAAAQLHLSKLLLARARPTEALTHAEAARAARPDSFDARLAVATALVAIGNLETAQKESRALIADYPRSPAVHVLSGELLSANSDSSGAARAFNRTLDLDPANLRALNERLSFDLRVNRQQDGRARLTRAFRVAPNWSPLFVLAARFENAAGDRQAALELLRRSIEADPDNLEAYGLLAADYLQRNKLDEAKAEFERLAKRRPDILGYRTMVGLILETQNKQDDAIKVYEEIVASSSRAPVAANNLAYIYAERDYKLDQAHRLAQIAKQQMPDRPEVDDTVGWIYYKRNLPTMAIPRLESSVAKDPKNAMYRLHLGLAYAKGGRPEDARRELNAALTIRPDFREALDARGRLTARE